MKNLFDAETTNEILTRLDSIKPGIKPLWGKMNVSQMMAHCIVPINNVLGITPAKRSLIGFLFGRMAKKQFLSGKPMKKNLPTDKTFLIKDERNFDEEKKKLQGVVRQFVTADKYMLTKNPHPFFGKLNTEELGKLNYLHLDHHFQQFGV